MKNNISSIDRVVRVIIALIFSALYITGTFTGVLAFVLLALGGVLVLTSAINYCPFVCFIKKHNS